MTLAFRHIVGFALASSLVAAALVARWLLGPEKARNLLIKVADEIAGDNS
jgi:hypothetical protein